MTLPLPELLFWIAAAACAIGQLAVLRSVITGRAPGAATPEAARRRRASEIVWALVPAGLLVLVLALTWRAVRASAGADAERTTATGLVTLSS